MNSIKQMIERCPPGLKIILPGIMNGVLVGTVLALLLPSVISLGSLLLESSASYRKTHLANNQWANAVVRPEHLLALVIVAAISLALIRRSSLISLSRRCFSATVYDPSVLWTACAFFMWLESRWSIRVLFAVAGLILTSAIARLRAPFSVDAESFLKVDRPIRAFSEDKLDRKALILSLVKRLISDGAPVIALIGAYGDGKTSILYLLENELRRQNTVVVRFKSSLPGDDLTLVSTLFNSISKQLRSRFFVRHLRNVLKRLTRRISGLVPHTTSGLREMFAEPSQQDELQELTDKLATLPVHRVVVMLDDMDRMQGSELRMLLKIIRASEDYPKLSFVCAFNKKALVDALVRHQVIDRITLSFASTSDTVPSGTAVGQISADDTRAGYEFLEKFFPVQVPVPKLDDGQIGKEFNYRFNQFAERNGMSMLPEDTAAFDEAFRPFWKPLFLPSLNNLRKINSYFNALNASFSLVKEEVNLIDFMCIELLRQIDPEIYEQVFKNRSLFYYPEWDILRWDERVVTLDDPTKKKKKRSDAAFDQVFRSLQGQERDFVLSLLGHLFPKVNAYRDARGLSSIGTPNEADADKNKHICHPDHFSTYFSLRVQEGYLSSQELNGLISGANEKATVAEAQTYFINYLRLLTGLKKYRLFEKTMRVADKLGLPQSKALATAIALESTTLAHDDFDMGEFGTAIRLVLVLANRFKDSPKITQVLNDVIAQSTSDAFVQRVFHFATQKDSNKIFDNWEFVDADALKAVFATRMKRKYFVGGEESIYAGTRTWREWQALLWWARVNDEERENVREYLGDEFERRPSSIGKHLVWLMPSIENPSGVKVVDDLFPLSKLAELAKVHGSKSYSNETERAAVMKVISKYGGSPNQEAGVFE
jgi:predicted KAP-like P-loop ATPase